MIQTGQHSYNTRSLDHVQTCYCRTEAFKNSLFQYTTAEWNKLDIDIRKSTSYTIFRNALLNIGWPNQYSVYRIHNSMGLKLLVWGLVSATSLNIDLIMIFKVVLTVYVAVALKLNQPHIFYCTAIFLKYSLNSLKQHKWSFLLILVIILWSKYYYLRIKIIFKRKIFI